MERQTLPGLDDVRAELSAESAPERSRDTELEPLELEEPGTWEDRREPERSRSPGWVARLGRLLGRSSDRG